MLMRNRKNGFVRRAFILALTFMFAGVGFIVAEPDAIAKNPNRLKRPADSGSDSADSFQSSPNRPNQFEQFTRGSDGDFNVGIRHDVIDSGAGTQGLQGGVGQPGLSGGASGQNLNGGVGQQGLNGGVGQKNLNAGIGNQGFQLQAPQYEKNKPLKTGTTTFAPLVGGITQVEVQRLEQHDVVLIIDRSYSMGKMDCPPVGRMGGPFGLPISRWDWCAAQTQGLASVTGTYNRGVKLMMFSRGFETFPDVTLQQVPSLFQKYQPNQQQGTDMVDPLRAVLGDYLRRRSAGKNPRPLAVAVIFDGLARKDSLPILGDAIVDVTKYMKNPDEIQITIFIVGNRGPRALERIYDMQRSLRRNGARYNILKIVPFNQVQQVGLAKALAETLTPDK